jgi:phosphopentomutase
VITADHGNVEMMYDPATGQPHTAHTLNLVPCLYVGREALMAGGGSLQDIAPTLLAIMGSRAGGNDGSSADFVRINARTLPGLALRYDRL